MSRILSLFDFVGFDPRKTVRTVRGLPRYFRDYRRLLADRQQQDNFTLGKFYPCLEDHDDESGMASGHYFHQDIIVARKILARDPVKHVDVGSRVDGFVAHVAVFREIEVFDIRPMSTTAKAISFRQLDIMAPLPAELRDYCDSLSCLHALEHFGLGRYGDPIDFRGHEKALANLSTLLTPGGTLYISVPIGPQRIEFNAHRVFAPKTLPDLLAGPFSLESFAYVDDAGAVHEGVDLGGPGSGENFGCHFGCGVYEFRKL
jgi:SAM-dependent methyltransferase